MKKLNLQFFKNLLTTKQKRGIIKVEKIEKVVFKLEKLLTLASKVNTQKFTVSNDKIKQTERNQLKSDVLDALEGDLTQGVDVLGRSKEGVIIGLRNEDEGVIYAVVDVVIKDLSFDPQELLDEYQTALEERAERERKTAEKRKAKA